MKRNLATLAALLAAALVIVLALNRRRPPAPQPTPEPGPSPEVVHAVTLEADHRVGAGRTFADGLTVFPILAQDQPDLGPFVTLEQALAAKTAEVRETSAGGTVNSLVIENKGDASLFVLAGTVVKGGKQDRQIAQDFAVGPHQTVAVDAFCVEQRRWNAARQGVATDGKFGTLKTLAHSTVRTAGQYKKNQGEVWAKVGEVNAANGKATDTGTLMATLDDKDIAARRDGLARSVSAFVDTLEPQGEVVGVAYAVGDKVRGVRWFANHQLYAMYRDTLFNTAAGEAVSAPRAAPSGARPGAPAPTAEAVKAFVDEIDKAPVAEERPTLGDNVNAYKESKRGYGSTSSFKGGAGWGTPKGAATGAPGTGKKPRSISSDFVAK